MATQTREELFEEFKKIDTDGNGTLSFEELTQFAASLPTQLTAEEVETIYKHMDIDGDGKVTFDEFYEWWNSKQNNLLPFLYKKQAFQKKITKLSRKVSENSKNQSSSAQQLNAYSVNLQVGESSTNSSLTFSTYSGELANQNSQAVRDALNLNPTEVHVVLQFNITSNLNEAKEALTTLVKQTEEFVQAILPPEVGGMYEQIVNTKVETFQENSLLLSVSSGFPMVQALVDQQVALSRQLTGEDQSTSVKFNLSSALDFQKFVDNQDSNVVTQLLTGLNVSVDVSTTEQARESLKHLLGNAIPSGGDQFIVGLLLGSLLNGFSVDLKLANLDELFAGLPAPPAGALIQIIGGKANLAAMVGSLPMVQDYVDFLTNNASSSLQVYAMVPGVLVQVGLNTQNFSAIFQKLLEVTPPEQEASEEPAQEAVESQDATNLPADEAAPQE